MADLPSGTVTFLFTDIEGSTALWERDRAAMATAVERHLDLLRGVVEAHRGVLYKTIGDGTQSAFPAAGTALAAALEGQRRLLADIWPDPPGPLRVRMALHAGEAEPRKGDYLAAPLNRLARLLAMARGSQVLLTEAVQQLVQDDVPPGASLAELGEIALRDLERPEHIFALAHPDLPSNVPHTRLGDDSTRHFPVSLTPFLGREVEIAGVVELLHSSDVRLVTLTGPGGTGKTRLAQEVGTRLAHEFTDGAVFVDLAPLREPALVLPEIAVMLGLHESPGRRLSDVTQGYLASRKMLLILDNFEHLLDAAPVVTDLLAAGSRVKALLTSRAPLRLRGEREYPVPTLRLPSLSDTSDLASLTANEAVAFFLARARSVRPDFTLTAQNASAVADICRRLDGLPLALELAAARVKMLPPPALLARLEARLPLLTGGARDAPERQRTLRDAIAWSHDLLSSDERRLFRRLGAFVGGWTLEAAEAVANLDQDLDVLEGLASLGDKSLVGLDESGNEPRYGMLGTIREFALERLAVSEDEIRVREVHARYFADVAREFDRALFTVQRRDWQMRVEAELPNLRAALAWLEERRDTEHLLLLGANAWHAFWERGKVGEAREWLNRGLALPGPVSTEARAAALVASALSAWTQGDNDDAEGIALTVLELSQSQGLDFQTGQALYTLMLVYQERGDFVRSVALGEDAILHFRRTENQTWLPQVLVDTGFNASLGGDFERASALREKGLALAREAGNAWTVAIGVSDLGVEAEARGEIPTAFEHYREGLALLLDIRDEIYIAHPLAGMASMAVKTGQTELAACLLGAVESIHELRGTTAWRFERERDERTEALVRAALGEARFSEQFVAGQRLAITEAARQALDEVQEVGPE